MYTGRGDPDEHVDTFDLLLDYRDASDHVRCKLFPLSLSKSALKWYRELPPASITSWSQFTKLFSSRFTASRVKPKSADVLQGVKQGEKETLREYLERYNQVADDVHQLSDEIRVMFMRHGLRKGTLFHRSVGLKKPATLDEFMTRAQKYIDFEEAEAVADTVSSQGKGKEGKDKKKKDSTSAGKEWRGRHSDYTDLTVSRDKLLSECINAEFRDVRWPAPIPQRSHTNKNLYCRYHRSSGHDTEECRVLKDDIEDLIKKGKLKQYVKDDGKKRDRSPKKSKATVNEVTGSPSDSSEEDTPRPQRQRPTAMVIMGGNSCEVRRTKRSIKRHWQEIFSVGAGNAPEITKAGRPPLSFSDTDLYHGKSNDEIPLVVAAVIAGVDVRRILIDQGSSVDILFKELLPKLKISEADIAEHDGSDLVGFDGSRARPIGFIKLQVTFGDDNLFKTVKTTFLVLPCPSPYHCIIGRPTLGKLGAVTSTTHLKMKFYSDKDEVVTVSADLDGAKRCQYLCLKAEKRALALAEAGR